MANKRNPKINIKTKHNRIITVNSRIQFYEPMANDRKTFGASAEFTCALCRGVFCVGTNFEDM